jgi:hypothetical protein
VYLFVPIITGLDSHDESRGLACDPAELMEHSVDRARAPEPGRLLTDG